MSKEDIAVLEPDLEEALDEATEERTRHKPPYAVVVLNDEHHTQDYVVGVLMKVFKYPLEKAAKLMFTAHHEGRVIVWTGPLEVAELKRDQIRACGPDYFSSKKIAYPLGVELEPLAE